MQHIKSHNAATAERSVGGTRHLVSAIYGGSDANTRPNYNNRRLCKVATAKQAAAILSSAPQTTSRMYSPHSNDYGRTMRYADYAVVHSDSASGVVKPEVKHTVVSTENVNVDLLIARAEKKDMTLAEYCEMIGLAL